MAVHMQIRLLRAGRATPCGYPASWPRARVSDEAGPADLQPRVYPSIPTTVGSCGVDGVDNLAQLLLDRIYPFGSQTEMLQQGH